jgi:hypothetical protein
VEPFIKRQRSCQCSVTEHPEMGEPEDSMEQVLPRSGWPRAASGRVMVRCILGGLPDSGKSPSAPS